MPNTSSKNVNIDLFNNAPCGDFDSSFSEEKEAKRLYSFFYISLARDFGAKIISTGGSGTNGISLSG